MVIEVSPVFLKELPSLILVTLFGMMIFFILAHSKKALLPIAVTFVPI